MDNFQAVEQGATIPPCFAMFAGLYYDVALKIRSGIPAKSVDAIAEFLDVRTETFARHLGIPTGSSNPDALMFKIELSRDLEPWEADRLYLVFRAYLAALDVFESKEGACSWLTSKIPVLGSVTPLSYLDTFAGFNLVEQTLNQIRHGVCA